MASPAHGPVNLKNAKHAEDPSPLDAESSCPAARDYSRAYLHHLLKANEMLGAILLTSVNVAYYQQLMADIRAAIRGGKFDLLRSQVVQVWRRTEGFVSEEPGTTNAGAPERSL